MDGVKKQPQPNNPLNNKTPATFAMDEKAKMDELKSKSPRIRSGKFDPSNRDPKMDTAVSGAYPEKQISRARAHADKIADEHDVKDQDI